MVSLRYFAEDGSYRELQVDAALSQSHTKTVEVTKHPIEDGADAADHAILRPDSYALDGLVSNTPLVSAAEMETGVYARRAETARDVLEGIAAARRPVTVDTGSKVLEQMMLSKLTFTASGGDCTRFNAALEQITTKRSETSAAVLPSGAGEIKHGGRQPTQAASAPVEKKTSVLKGLVDGLRGKAP